MDETEFVCERCSKLTKQADTLYGICDRCIELSIMETEAYLRAIGLLDLP